MSTGSSKGGGSNYRSSTMDALTVSDVLHRRLAMIGLSLPPEKYAEYELLEASIRHLKRLIEAEGPNVMVSRKELGRLLRGRT